MLSMDPNVKLMEAGQNGHHN